MHDQDAVEDTFVAGVKYHWSLWKGPAPTREALVALAPDRLLPSPET